MAEFSVNREKLMGIGLITLSYCFEDIYRSAPKFFQKAVDLMTDEELEKFIDENLHSWENGIESGLCTDQAVVLSTCATELASIPNVFGKKRLEDAKKGIHPCLSCEDKVKGKWDHECEAEEYCVAICAYTDFCYAKAQAFDLLISDEVYRKHIFGGCDCNSEKKCIAGRYLGGEIGPEEVIRLISGQEEKQNVAK